jgi:hypothetical protein
MIMIRRGIWGFILFLLLCLMIFKPADLDALDSNLRINVIPGNITFNILNPDPLPQYYSCDRQVSVQTWHTWRRNYRQWHVGIKAAGAFLVDNINPANQIPITRLRWSSDGINFHVLGEQWQLVNTYTDRANRQHTETITYRLYPDRIYTAGQYTVQIKFDARWNAWPWW